MAEENHNLTFGIDSNQINREYSHRKFRFWPVFAMSFLRTFFFSLYSLALPNYLIYEREISPSLVGLISSMSSIAYIIGPWFGRKITERIGIKNTLIISTSLSFLSIILSVFLVIPWVLVIVRAVDGFVNGFFWPNAINLISSWEKRYESTKARDMLKIFNNSWNFGLISGFILGYVYVQFIGNDFQVLIISSIFAFLMIPSSISLEKCNDFQIVNNRAVVIQDFHINRTTKTNNEHEKVRCDNFSRDIPSDIPAEERTPPDAIEYKLVKLPIFMAFGGVLVYASSKSILKFTLPYFFKDMGITSAWVYFVVLFQQMMQITALNIMSRVTVKKYAFFSGLFSLIGITIVFLLSPGAFLIGVLVIFSGLSIGLMQGVTQRIVMDYTKFHNTTKYSMLNEIFAGISFGIIPIIGGILLEENIIYDYIFLLCLLLVIGAVLFYLSEQYIKKYEK